MSEKPKVSRIIILNINMRRTFMTLCYTITVYLSAMCLISCFENDKSQSQPYYNLSFQGKGDGYIYQGRNIGLIRVVSGIVDYFPEYKKGAATYVKVGSSYIRVSGQRFVSISNIDYYGI